MPNWKKVLVSGSNAHLNQVTASSGIHLADNAFLNLGDGNDLQLYHDGNHSYIKDNGTGNLHYRGGTQTFQNGAGSKTMVTLNSANSVDLNYNNSTRFRTTNAGVSVTGEVRTSAGTTITGSLYVSGSIGGTASTATWTTSGSGTFNNDVSLGAVYTPSLGDLSLGSVALTLTTDDPAGACVAEQSTMNLTINEGASVSVTTPLTECIGDEFTLNAVIDGAASTLTWSNGTGTFLPNASSPTATYVPSAAENTAGIMALDVTTDDPDGAGPCLAATEVVILQIDGEAIVSAGPDDVVCSNTSYGLSLSLIQI